MTDSPPLHIINEVRDSEIAARDVFATKLVIKLTIDGEPVSKQRPRMSIGRGGHVYTPKTTRQAEDVIGWSIRMAYRMLVPEPDGAFAVYLHFFTKNRQRRDLDNMCKLVFDACNGIVWRDDAQVEALTARVTRQDPKPRTELEIYRIVGDTPFVKCEACSRTFRTYPSWPHRKFCSRECMAASRRNGIEVTCANCDVIVHRANLQISESGRHYCSPECKSLYGTREISCSGCSVAFRTPKSFATRGKRYCSKQCQADHAKTRRLAKPGPGICETCGGPTSKKEYRRCRACLHEAQVNGTASSGGRPARAQT